MIAGISQLERALTLLNAVEPASFLQKRDAARASPCRAACALQFTTARFLATRRVLSERHAKEHRSKGFCWEVFCFLVARNSR